MDDKPGRIVLEQSTCIRELQNRQISRLYSEAIKIKAVVNKNALGKYEGVSFRVPGWIGQKWTAEPNAFAYIWNSYLTAGSRKLVHRKYPKMCLNATREKSENPTPERTAPQMASRKRPEDFTSPVVTFAHTQTTAHGVGRSADRRALVFRTWVTRHVLSALLLNYHSTPLEAGLRTSTMILQKFQLSRVFGCSWWFARRFSQPLSQICTLNSATRRGVGKTWQDFDLPANSW